MAHELVTWRGVRWRVQVVTEGGPGISTWPRCVGVQVDGEVDPVEWGSFSQLEPAEWLAGALDVVELEALAVRAYLDDGPDYG